MNHYFRWSLPTRRQVKVRNAKGHILKRPIAKKVSLHKDIPASTGTSKDVKKSVRIKNKQFLCNVDVHYGVDDDDLEDGVVIDCSHLTTMMYPTEERYMIMPTVLLRLIDDIGNVVWVRALWDSGASGAIITKTIREALFVSNENSTIQQTHTSGLMLGASFENIKITFMPHSGTKVYTGNIKVMTALGPIVLYPDSPIAQVATTAPLADPFYYCPMDIHMIIGTDWISKTKIRGADERARGYPHVTHTIFGDLWDGLMDTNYMADNGRVTSTAQHHAPTGAFAQEFQKRYTIPIEIEVRNFKGINKGDDSEWTQEHTVRPKTNPLTPKIHKLNQKLAQQQLMIAYQNEKLVLKEKLIQSEQLLQKKTLAKNEELTKSMTRHKRVSIFSSILLVAVILGGFCIRAGSSLN